MNIMKVWTGNTFLLYRSIRTRRKSFLILDSLTFGRSELMRMLLVSTAVEEGSKGAGIVDIDWRGISLGLIAVTPLTMRGIAMDETSIPSAVIIESYWFAPGMKSSSSLSSLVWPSSASLSGMNSPSSPSSTTFSSRALSLSSSASMEELAEAAAAILAAFSAADR